MDNLLALLTALGGLAGLAGLVSALAAARNAVKQSDLQALRDTIAALEAENTRLRACIEALRPTRRRPPQDRRPRRPDRIPQARERPPAAPHRRAGGRERPPPRHRRCAMSNRDRYTQQRVIDAIQAARGIKATAAANLKCSRQTITNYIDRYPAVKAAYDEAIQTSSIWPSPN